MFEILREPEAAAEITTLPLEYFPVDACVLYNDLSTPFFAAGLDVEMRTGVGPVVDRPIRGPADVDALRLVDGRLDLDVVEAMHPTLAALSSSLATALDDLGAADSPWLAPNVADRLDQLTGGLESLAEGASLGTSATAVLPDLLGASGPRTYLVGFTTPAEARGLGGFLGNYAEIEAVDGQLDLVRTGSVGELTDSLPPDPVLHGLDDYLGRYGYLRPARYPGNVTASPSFPAVADALAQIYPQLPGGRPVDGVFLVDPEGLAGILAVTGPVTVPGLDRPFAAEGAAEFLLRGQYDLAVGVDQQARTDLLDDIVGATFEALTEATLPGPRRRPRPAPRDRRGACGPTAAGGRASPSRRGGRRSAPGG